MKIYKVRNNKFYFGIVNRGRTLRIAFFGYAIHISIKRLKRFAVTALEFWIVLIATLALFRLGQVYALQERDYFAYGGEYMLLLLPLIYYTTKSTIITGNKKSRKTAGTVKAAKKNIFN